jgi:hypothetical protein
VQVAFAQCRETGVHSSCHSLRLVNFHSDLDIVLLPRDASGVECKHHHSLCIRCKRNERCNVLRCVWHGYVSFVASPSWSRAKVQEVAQCKILVLRACVYMRMCICVCVCARACAYASHTLAIRITIASLQCYIEMLYQLSSCLNATAAVATSQAPASISLALLA